MKKAMTANPIHTSSFQAQNPFCDNLLCRSSVDQTFNLKTPTSLYFLLFYTWIYDRISLLDLTPYMIMAMIVC